MQESNIHEKIEDKVFTQEESNNQMRVFEDDILKGMLAASNFPNTETLQIEIARGNTVYFTFGIHALTEEQYERAKKKATRFVRNKQLGITMPEETDNSLYRSLLIYFATNETDRKKTWDNKRLWTALEGAGKDVLTGTDVINLVLMPGEKAMVIEQIDHISGFQNDNLEEVIKN